MDGLASRSARALMWVAPFVFIALVVAGERAVILHPQRLAVLPWTAKWNEWLRPGVQHLDQKLVGYALMAVGAAAFAAIIARRTPSAATFGAAERPGGQPLLPWRPSLPEIVALAVAAISWAYALRAVYEQERDTRTPAIMLLAVLVFAVVFIRRDLSARVRFTLRIEPWEAAIVVLLTAAAAAVLLYELKDMPVGIWGDEGSFWETAVGHHPREIIRDPFRPGVYGFPFASSLPPSVAAEWFGHDIVAWRASSVLFAVLTVPPLYFLSRHMFGRTAACATAVVFFSSPYLLAFGRMGYNNIQALLPVVLSAALSLAALQRRSAALFFAAGAAAGLGFYVYSAGRLAPMLLGVLLIHAGLVRRLSWKEAGFALALAALGTIMVGFPPALSGLVDPVPDARRKMVEALFLHEGYVRTVFPDKPVETFHKFEWSGVPFLFDPLITIRLLGRGVVRTLLSLHDEDIVNFHYIRGPLAGRWISALVLPGIAIAVSRIRTPGIGMLLAWTLLALILLSIINGGPPQQTHLVPIIPVLAIWIGATIGVLADHLRGLSWRWAPAAATAIAAIAVTVLAVLGIREYRAAAPDFLAHAEMAVWWEAMELEDEEYVVWVHTAPHYLTETPLGIRMFDLQDHYTYMPLEEMLTANGQAELVRASAVVVGARAVPDPAGRDFPYEVARIALPGWTIEPLFNLTEPRGWIFRPPGE
jgi:4-amino-4-deoxy-L-arabinose transferase-like glycosyltransferase